MAPTMMTGPVGAPVGEPPGGSMLTASFSAANSAMDCASLSTRASSPCRGNNPRDTGGLPSPGNAHSS